MKLSDEWLLNKREEDLARLRQIMQQVWDAEDSIVYLITQNSIPLSNIIPKYYPILTEAIYIDIDMSFVELGKLLKNYKAEWEDLTEIGEFTLFSNVYSSEAYNLKCYRCKTNRITIKELK